MKIAGFLLIVLHTLILPQSYCQIVVSPDSALKKHSQLLDSTVLEGTRGYALFVGQYDSIGEHYNSQVTRLEHKRDSLLKLGLKIDKFTQRIDSLNQIKEKNLSDIKNKGDEIYASSIGRLEKLNLPPELKKNIDEYATAVGKLDITVPSSQFTVPGLQLPNDFNSSVPAMNRVLGVGLPNLPETGFGATEAISENVSQVGELADAVPKNLNTENLGQAAEASFVKINEIDAVKDQIGDLPANPLTSEEEIRTELINQAKDAAVDHFAGKEQELKPVMDQISKYKKRFLNVNNLKELESYIKKRPNEMKGKPVIEKIVPGIVFQIQKKNDELYVDFNPYVGYRFTGKLTAGLGWNQRVPYNLNSYTFQSDGRIYGPRTFAEYKLWKGFSPRLEGETMNTFVPPYIRKSPGDVGGREWVWGVFGGMKKDYKFFRKINGTAAVMFRLFDPHRKSPYADVVNARFGFEFPMKKRAKSTPQ